MYHILCLTLLVLRTNAWNSLPPQLLKTKTGYQILTTLPTEKIDALRCDTPFKCKTAVVENSIGSCTICEDELGLPASPYYGSDQDVEVSPYDQVHLPTFSESEGSEAAEEADEPPPSADQSTEEANALEEKKKEQQQNDPNFGCAPRIDDEFVLPCCSPIRSLTGELTIKPAPTSFLETLSRRNTKLRTNRNKLEFVSSVLPCCGTGPSCCRWCKDICDDLEDTGNQRLWWALCNGADTDDTEKTNWYRQIDETMYGKRPGSVGGGSQSAGGAAMAGMAGGLFRL